MRLEGKILNLRERAGCDVLVSWSDHGPIMVGSFSNRLAIGCSNSQHFRSNLDLAFLRKSRRIRAFCDLGVLLLLLFSCWAMFGGLFCDLHCRAGDVFFLTRAMFGPLLLLHGHDTGAL